MSRSSQAISTYLAQRIAAGDFPSAVYLVAERGQTVLSDALGHAVVAPYSIAANQETIYDLASLTKPLITTLLCARRIELGEIAIDSSVSHYLPEFDRADKHMITVRELLTHTSGLPAWRPLYILAEGESERTLGVIANETLESKPGTHVCYSDLGFITLGFLLERLTGKHLNQLARSEIFEPLELQHTCFNPDVELQTRIAACETGNVFEQETCAQQGFGFYDKWRHNLVWGVVHDGNAYFLNGAAGHAGLFSTAAETFRLGQQFLASSTRLLQPGTCDLFHTNMTPRLEEARSAGWQLAATPSSTAGAALPPRSFGHTGFTGTSCWIDPDHERIFILLTNRTHARRPPFENINEVRRTFHALAVQELETAG